MEKERNLEETIKIKEKKEAKVEVKKTPEPPKKISTIKRERNLGKRKTKAPKPPPKASQNIQRSNPFDEMSEDEEVNSRNPFEDSNPFAQDENDSNPFTNGPTNSFEDHPINPFAATPEENEETNPFATINGTSPPQNKSVQPNFSESIEDTNYEVKVV